ncbi:hypothetical protein J2Y69_000828 [Microbacterium resistens]|uniref:DUF5134 domain-containing protein n=1 Tax=Microbacterium resistens TaxID=156977 RepID=A0ABU1S9G3_9MICO|nr:hypothetical protein [Microbacterium resistens]MDR6866236.1 hypothetical protein [Microbacterium resistens]
MVHAHPAAMWLMLASAITAAVCCLLAGRTVPWQGRQAAVAMAAGMIVLSTGLGETGLGEDGLGEDGLGEGFTVLVAAGWILSAMVGTAGLRGHPAAVACCHRAVGGVVMAACALAALPVRGGGHATAHVGHGIPQLSALTGIAVLAMVVWAAVEHRSGRARRSPPGRRARLQDRLSDVLLGLEPIAMSIGLVAMWAGHA